MQLRYHEDLLAQLMDMATQRKYFAEENNVWVTRIMKSILCNYREEAIFPADEIAIYVPQAGERQCP